MGLHEKWGSETAADWIVTPSKVKLKPLKFNIGKGNPYHDPKDGKFTFGPGGGVKSFLPPKALSKCKEIEKESVKLSKEQLTVIDDNGNIILQKGGNEVSVSLTPADLGKMDNATLTHNHPGEFGGPLSNNDLAVFLSAYAKGVRAVAKEGTYSLERGQAEYEDIYDFVRAANRMVSGIHKEMFSFRKEMQQNVADGKMSEDKANQKLEGKRREFLTKMSSEYGRLAKQHGLSYTFEPSGEVQKFNPYHDPKSGRFSSKGGGTAYNSKTITSQYKETENMNEYDFYLEEQENFRFSAIQKLTGVDEDKAKEYLDALCGTRDDYLRSANYRGDAPLSWFFGGDYSIRNGTSEADIKKAEIIHDYIERAPKYEGTIYRGIKLTDEQVKSLQKGGDFVENGRLSSWTSDNAVAHQFADYDVADNQKAVILSMKNPKHGTPVAHLSIYGKEEQEVLVSNMKNPKYKIAKVTEIDNKVYVEIEEG